MRSGLFLPPFDALANPAIVARLSAEAEDAGWDGVFVWDHVGWREPVAAIADPWVTLAAMATATERIRLGPIVTPLARRRPVKVARETATGKPVELGDDEGVAGSTRCKCLSRPRAGATGSCETVIYVHPLLGHAHRVQRLVLRRQSCDSVETRALANQQTAHVYERPT